MAVAEGRFYEVWRLDMLCCPVRYSLTISPPLPASYVFLYYLLNIPPFSPSLHPLFLPSQVLQTYILLRSFLIVIVDIHSFTYSGL
jgi:hypothetical protein